MPELKVEWMLHQMKTRHSNLNAKFIYVHFSSNQDYCKEIYINFKEIHLEPY